MDIVYCLKPPTSQDEISYLKKNLAYRVENLEPVFLTAISNCYKHQEFKRPVTKILYHLVQPDLNIGSFCIIFDGMYIKTVSSFIYQATSLAVYVKISRNLF